MTTQASGIMYVANDGKVLFLKRGPGGDHPGEWCFPGGRQEEGEDAMMAARREYLEEAGVEAPEGLVLWSRRREMDVRRPFGYSEASEHAPPPGGAPVGPGQAPNSAQVVARLEPPAAGNLGAEDVDFTTFLARGPIFVPLLCNEHTAYAWADPATPPEPLHPGCRVAIAKMSMNELDIAKAIADGELTSPQQYENIWLFDLRVTGTGTAYRKRYDEHAYRPPELYLTPEFLQRCQGLPVIIEHPENRSVLNTEEFADRVIGTVLLPYVRGDEVWGVAKIYDQKAAEIMRDEQLSTSPSVVFRDPSVNAKLELEDGSTLLIEGKPSLLDHLAVCAVGVWDKGGDPAGVVSAEIRGDSEMPEAMEEKKAEERREDADAGQKLDKVLECLDSVGGRLDALAHRMDAHEEELKEVREERKDRSRKDAKRKDEEREEDDDDDKREDDDDDKREDEEDGERDDGKKGQGRYGLGSRQKPRKDGEEEAAEVVADRKRKDDDDRKDAVFTDADRELLKRLRDTAVVEPTPTERAAFADAQARADSVYQLHGDQAPRPMLGEVVLAYRKRLASKFKAMSPDFKDVDIDAINDSALLGIAEKNIFEAARLAALNPTDLPAGQFREIVRVDQATGARSVTFHGTGTFFGAFSRRGRRVAKINLTQPREA